MHKLKGSGTTFSTSGKPWLPFRYDPKLAARAARMHRLIREGKLKPMSKEQMRKLADEAMKSR